MVGSTSAYVYEVVLQLLTKDVPRCRPDRFMDAPSMMDDGPPVITTDAILDNLKTSADLSLGLGKPGRDKISAKAAEKIEENAPNSRTPIVPEAVEDGDGSGDEDEDEDDSGDDDDDDEEKYDSDFRQNGEPNGPKVKFADARPGAKEQRLDRPTLLRQHLLRLAETNQHFLRHCGHNEWTVDFGPLMQALRDAEAEVVVRQQFDIQGLRLFRILKDKGKLDEKGLLNIGLVGKKMIQATMLAMMMTGLVSQQEVPRDNKADCKKSIWLWYVDAKQVDRLLLQRTYKSMARTMQILARFRRQDKTLLDMAQRSDVIGKEKELLFDRDYERLARFLKNERKLMGQVMRLDDVVSLLRDF